MQSLSRRLRFGPILPASLAVSLLAFAINGAYAADAPAPAPADAPVATVVVGGTRAATDSAPSQGSLTAHTPQSEVSDAFIRQYMAPASDFSQAIQMTPGMFSYSPNGAGLGDTQSTFRGLATGNFNMTFDGIPFQDTNGVSQHSWVFFPSPFLGGAVVDRSPGSAATIGQATFNGSVNLLSRPLEQQARNTASASLGSWNTQVYGFEHETGQFGADNNQNFLFTVQDMKSDGYQTFNGQKRGDASLKYQNALSENTVVTVFASYLNLRNNTPNIKGPTRAQVAQFGNDYLLSGDPTQPNYYGYNFYNITTDFEYLELASNLGNGWKLDDKVYTYSYWNKQNFNGTKVPTSLANTTANQTAVDKLNSYRTSGNLLRLSNDSSYGTFRTGLWSDYAKSYRFQIPSNPLTWQDSPIPNFSETYQTTTLQPFAEFEFKVSENLTITPGVKYAFYHQHFKHLADSTVVLGLGGAPFIINAVSYHDVLPSLDLHYMLQPNWSLYAQYGKGDLIPPTGVFDVKNAFVAVQPKAQHSTTTQAGTVWKSDRYTLDFDAYYTKLDAAYSSTNDTFNNPVYFLNGSEVTKGVEAEGNVVLGGGFSAYLNGTYGSAKYNTGMWVAGAPQDTETLGLNYKQAAWDIGWFTKRVGQTYADNGSVHQAFTINPVTVSNLFANYAFRTPQSFAKLVKLQFGVNNLFNRQSITNILKAGTATSSSANPSPLDQLQLLPQRSVTLTVSADF